MNDIQLAWSFLGFIFLLSVASIFVNPVKIKSNIVSILVIVGKIIFICFVIFPFIAVLIWALEVVTK